MGEILFSCGSNRRAVIATLSISENDIQRFEGISKDEVPWLLYRILILVICVASRGSRLN